MATRTAVREFFRTIRRGDLVRAMGMLNGDPALIGVTATAPPKKDDGQSPLQVALKTGNIEIANLLLDRGADPRFMEASSINAWRAPALHDALRGAIAWIGPSSGAYGGYFDGHAALVDRMLALGADPNSVDSYGNTCFDVVALVVRQANRTRSDWAGVAGRNVRRIVEALRSHGGDLRQLGQHGTTTASWMRDHPTAALFEP